MRSNHGFTLMEVMVTACIFIALLALGYQMYVAGIDVWETDRHQAELQADSRIALRTLTQELQRGTRTSTRVPSPNATIPASPANTQITFCLPADIDGNGLITSAAGAVEWDTAAPVTYQFVANDGTLVRTQSGVSRIVARDVTGFQVFDAAQDAQLAATEIRIVLNMGALTGHRRPVTSAVTALARLRN